MDVSYLLEDLNDAQREAVSMPPGNCLVLAGAGSGKTRVLVHRIAWLIKVHNVSPHGLLAVTFTNKAAGEMRHRTEQLLETPSRGLWVGTFHGIAHRLLRMHHDEAGLPDTFQILDSDDQYRVLRRVIQDSGLDESRWPARQAQWFINDQKDAGRRAASIDTGDDPIVQQWVDIYRAYEQSCQQSGMVDFAELLFRAHELWLHQPELLTHYQNRFGHLLVDEFQDTNTIQYAWLRVLAGETGNAFVVGDDDQSIYGWRGAKVENIHAFTRDFADVKTVRLEQNYRSTATILDTANALISNNQGRMGKNLWTDGERGEPVEVYAAFNEHDESRFIAETIEQAIGQDFSARDIAILYRSNAQSRLFEEALLTRRIPYRVYGGLRFFERAEIKDVLAYLRLLHNRNDDTAFERVVNVPARGIGNKTTSDLREAARVFDDSLWNTTLRSLQGGSLAARPKRCLTDFVRLIEQLSNECADMTLDETVDHIIVVTGLHAHYDKEPPERAETRKENLGELINAAASYVMPDEDEEAGLTEMASFLSHAALEAGEGQVEDWESGVQLMSMHSAKGLEFPLVFIAGMEDGLFPHQRSLDEAGRLEEERRLCYVAITRARQRLYLSFAESRRVRGSETYSRPSRFISELPRELLHEIRPRAQLSRPTSLGTRSAKALDDAPPLNLGQRVQHKKYGPGVVMDYEGDGAHTLVQVNFEGPGTKWLVLAYANLELV